MIPILASEKRFIESKRRNGRRIYHRRPWLCSVPLAFYPFCALLHTSRSIDRHSHRQLHPSEIEGSMACIHVRAIGFHKKYCIFARILMLEGIVGIACTMYAYKRIYFEDNRFDEKLPEMESQLLAWSGQWGVSTDSNGDRTIKARERAGCKTYCE